MHILNLEKNAQNERFFMLLFKKECQNHDKGIIIVTKDIEKRDEMIAFVKGFSTKLSLQIQMLILALVSLYVLFIGLQNQTDIIDILQGLLPKLLILGAVWLLFLGKKILAAYLVLFFMQFSSGVTDLVEWVLSYSIGANDFFLFDFTLIVNAVICAYLAILILSIFLIDGYKIQPLNIKKSSLWILYAFFMLYIYINNSFASVILITLYLFIIYNARSIKALLFLMACYLINIPLNIVERFIDNTAKFVRINIWVADFLGIFILYLIVMQFLSLPKLKVQE
jgi:hypothetical protein